MQIDRPRLSQSAVDHFVETLVRCGEYGRLRAAEIERIYVRIRQARVRPHSSRVTAAEHAVRRAEKQPAALGIDRQRANLRRGLRGGGAPGEAAVQRDEERRAEALRDPVVREWEAGVDDDARGGKPSGCALPGICTVVRLHAPGDVR